MGTSRIGQSNCDTDETLEQEIYLSKNNYQVRKLQAERLMLPQTLNCHANSECHPNVKERQAERLQASTLKILYQLTITHNYKRKMRRMH
jgi:hypothetical protein